MAVVPCVTDLCEPHVSQRLDDGWAVGGEEPVRPLCLPLPQHAILRQAPRLQLPYGRRAKGMFSTQITLSAVAHTRVHLCHVYMNPKRDMCAFGCIMGPLTVV